MSFVGKTFRLLGFLKRHRRPKTAAVILAAGVGSRMQSCDGKTKQLMLLKGVPVFLHTVLAFDRAPTIDEIVLVIKKEEAKEIQRALRGAAPLKKPIRLVSGGDTRQDSARRGLEAVSKDMMYVAVHDAARCLVTPQMIDDVVLAAHRHRAASAGCRVTDTIKLVSATGFVEKTLDRDRLFRAQTPQAFEKKLYYAATYVAYEEKRAVTDDNMLLEAIGQAVKMVDCGYENIKVTTGEDLLLADAILDSRALGAN